MLGGGTPIFSNVEILGEEILVNGTHAPYFEATTELVRLRLLNASNARVYNPGFSDNREYSLVGTEFRSRTRSTGIEFVLAP